MSATAPEAPPRPERRLVFLLLIAVLLVFARVASHGFLTWDDRYTLQENPRLNPPTTGSVIHYWTHPEFGLYIPVTYTAWSALAAVARVDAVPPRGAFLRPSVFHIASVVLHLLSVLAVLAILRRLSGNDRAACAGALLFATHPVQVEPVAWASGTKDVLAGLLALTAVLQYLASTGNPRRRVLATLAFVLALLAKPQALVTPLIVFALDVWIVGRSWRASLRALWPWFGLALACAASTRLVQGPPMMTDSPAWARPLVAADALAFYLLKLVVPCPLTPDYGRTPALAIERGWIYWTWLAPVGLAALVWIFRKRAPWLLAAAAVFVAGVLPVLGLSRFLFQQYSTVADRYLYLSMLGPAIAITWLLRRFRARWLAVACALWLGVLGTMSTLQAGLWKDDVTLFTHATSITPRSFVSHNNLGAALMESGRYDEARVHFRAALAIWPDYPAPRQNLEAIANRERLLRTPR